MLILCNKKSKKFFHSLFFFFEIKSKLTFADYSQTVGGGYLKSDSHFPRIIFICFNESLLKVMKNAFYFMLKALFILKIFKIFVWTYWSYRRNGLIRKIKLISKYLASQPG